MGYVHNKSEQLRSIILNKKFRNLTSIYQRIKGIMKKNIYLKKNG